MILSPVWADYRILGQELYDNAANTAHENADLRTSISRTYYGTFHYARFKLFSRWTITVSDDPTVHSEVIAWYKKKKYQIIADLLACMRAARNQADYYDTFDNLRDIAEDTLDRSQEVVDLLDNL